MLPSTSLIHCLPFKWDLISSIEFLLWSKRSLLCLSVKIPLLSDICFLKHRLPLHERVFPSCVWRQTAICNSYIALYTWALSACDSVASHRSIQCLWDSDGTRHQDCIDSFVQLGQLDRGIMRTLLILSGSKHATVRTITLSLVSTNLGKSNMGMSKLYHLVLYTGVQAQQWQGFKIA